MSLPMNFLAPDLEPNHGKAKPVDVVVPQPQEPLVKPKRPDYGGVNLAVTDNFCIEAKASACEAMKDLCAAMNSMHPGAAANLCDGVQSFCEKQQQMGGHLHMDLNAKICMNFEASAKACEVVTEVCKPGSKAAGSSFCQRAQAYCAK